MPRLQPRSSLAGIPTMHASTASTSLRSRPARLIASSFAFAGLFASSALAHTFQGIGWLSDESPSSYASAISGDGLTVIGQSYYGPGSDPFTFRWTAADGMQVVPQLNPEWVYSQPTGVSYDGSVIVGHDYRIEPDPTETGSNIQSFIWTAGPAATDPGTTTGLPYAGVYYTFSEAYAVSADGTTVVGMDGGLSPRAYRWTVGSTTPQLLGPEDTYSEARGVSANGGVIVGEVDGRAFRWVEGSALDDLEILSIPDADSSNASAVSADGTTTVGSFQTQDGIEHAFAWTLGGFVELTALSSDDYTMTHAHAVSADGHWAVGSSGDYYGTAVLWDTTTGQVWDLNDLFASTLGFEGWFLQHATGISADGLTITGYGLDPDGNDQSWIATLSAHPSSVPEPSTCATLAGVLVLGLVVARRRNHQS